VDDNGDWIGTDKYFKIDDFVAFTVHDGVFSQGGNSPIIRGFYKLDLTDEITTQGFR
jgi:hypothetical protein